MKKIVLAAILMSGAIVLSGCNTVAGLGTDLKRVLNTWVRRLNERVIA